MTDVTLNNEQRLYVIPEGNGYSCLGFDVLMDRYSNLAAEMGRGPIDPNLRGTLAAYYSYNALLTQASDSGRRFTSELTPQFIGLEGHRVEVTDRHGETRRFIVGKSTGWMPIHLEIKRRDSIGGMGASREYAKVRDLGRVTR